MRVFVRGTKSTTIRKFGDGKECTYYLKLVMGALAGLSYRDCLLFFIAAYFPSPPGPQQNASISSLVLLAQSSAYWSKRSCSMVSSLRNLFHVISSSLRHRKMSGSVLFALFVVRIRSEFREWGERLTDFLRCIGICLECSNLRGLYLGMDAF